MLPKEIGLHVAAKVELKIRLRISLHTPHQLLSSILTSPSHLHEPKMDTEFLQIVESFKANAELTPKERDSFQFSSLNDVLSTLRSIQDKQSKTKRLVFMRGIDPFLKTMVEYGKVRGLCQFIRDPCISLGELHCSSNLLALVVRGIRPLTSLGADKVSSPGNIIRYEIPSLS